ncbi:hypothetical protein RFI_37567, partial [Reticulomyxa filosa]
NYVYSHAKKFNSFLVACFFILILKKNYMHSKNFDHIIKAINLSEEKIKEIIKYWIRKLNVRLGWIQDFDKLVVNYRYQLQYSNVYLTYAYIFFMFDTFRSSKLINTFTGHPTLCGVLIIQHLMIVDSF